MSISLIPDTAPFNPEQRAWLNGFLAGWLGLQENLPAPGELPASAPAVEEFPWHDPALTIDQRLELADGSPLERKFMATMAQLDCGTCGYVCQTYAEAIARGEEKSLTLCTPGGAETSKALKRLLKESPRPADTGGNLASGTSTRETGWSRTRPYPAKLLRSINLNRPGSSKATHHVELDLGDSGLTYQAGDALGVYPTNCRELVHELIRELGADASEEVVLSSLGPMRLDEALTRHLCLKERTESLFETLANAARSPEDASHLRQLVDDDTLPPEWDVLDVLRQFASARPSSADFVGALAMLKPRLYSISSSPKKHPGQVHLTVGRVTEHANGRLRKGVASTMFADRIAEGDPVPVFVHQARGFTVPSDPKTPMIMIGPGTGIAPFRAFLEEREATGATGRNWLFFGDQRSALDFLYEDELAQFVQRGLLSRLDTAFSRDQDRKIYVQHRMVEQGAELFRWLEEGASVFVCGDAKRMAVDVHNALIEVVRTHGRLDQDGAKAYVDGLTQSGRYHRDVY